MAARLRELGIAQKQVADVAGCSRAMVTQVLSGRVGVRARGRRDPVLRAALALIAAAEEHSRADADTQPAHAALSPSVSSSLREARDRERTELEELRRRAAQERTAAAEARAALRHERQRLEVERRALARETTARLSRRVAVALSARLKRAGIQQQQVAKVAGVTPSAVCNVLAGRAPGMAVVVAVERLLAKAAARLGQ